MALVLLSTIGSMTRLSKDHLGSWPIYSGDHILDDLELDLQGQMSRSKFLKHICPCNTETKSLRGMISSPISHIITFQVIIFWMTLSMTFEVKCRGQRSILNIWPDNSGNHVTWRHDVKSYPIVLPMAFQMVTFWMTLRLPFEVK